MQGPNELLLVEAALASNKLTGTNHLNVEKVSASINIDKKRGLNDDPFDINNLQSLLLSPALLIHILPLTLPLGLPCSRSSPDH